MVSEHIRDGFAPGGDDPVDGGAPVLRQLLLTKQPVLPNSPLQDHSRIYFFHQLRIGR